MSIDTNLQNLFKTLYPPGVPQNVVTRKRVWLKEVEKPDDFEGLNMVIPVDYVNPQGRSATFSTAQTNASGGTSQSIKWTLTRVTDYAVVQLTAEDIRASRSNKGAFAQMVKHDSDMALDALGESAAIALYGDGSGYIGIIATAGISGATITLTRAHDVKNFHKGNAIVFAPTSTGTLRNSGNTLTVASISYTAGTVTFTANVSTLNAVSAGDYCFIQGDQSLKMAGLAGWLPLTAPTVGGGDSWFGVDRSIDPESLAGWRVNTPSASIEENFLTLGELIAFGGGAPDLALINPTNYATLIKGLGSKVMYTSAESANIGFKGAIVQLSTGPVKVMPDPECPSNVAYLLTSDTWKLHTLDEFPHTVQDDGLPMLRQTTADGVEIRFRYWANLACTAPRRNGAAQLA